MPVATILRSNLFFDASVRRRRVKCPVEFAVGTIRSLEVVKPTVQAGALAKVVRPDGPEPVCPAQRGRLGMGTCLDQLGDPAGAGQPRAWPCSRTTTRPWAGAAIPAKLAGRHGFHRPAEAARFLLDLLLPGPLEPAVRDPILKAPLARAADGDAALRDAARRILNLPEYQLA